MSMQAKVAMCRGQQQYGGKWLDLQSQDYIDDRSGSGVLPCGTIKGRKRRKTS